MSGGQGLPEDVGCALPHRRVRDGGDERVPGPELGAGGQLFGRIGPSVVRRPSGEQTTSLHGATHVDEEGERRVDAGAQVDEPRDPAPDTAVRVDVEPKTEKAVHRAGPLPPHERRATR